MQGGRYSLDPKDVLSLAMRHKWLILLPVIFVTGAAAGGSYFVTPRYESSVVIQMGNPVKLSNDLRRMLGDFGDASGTGRAVQPDVRDYQRQIASPPYASKILERVALRDSVEFNQRVERLTLSQPDMSQQAIRVMLMGWRLASVIELNFVSSSHLKVTASSKDPYEARDLAHTVGVVFAEEQAREDLQSIFLSLDFSYEQLARYEKELKDKLDEKTELEKEIDKWQSDNSLSTEPNRIDLASEIERRTQEIGDLRDEQRTLEAALVRLGVEKVAVDDPRPLQEKKLQIIDLVESVETLVQDYAWKDPAISNVQLRAVRLEDQVEDEHQALVESKFGGLSVPVKAQISRVLDIRHRLNVLDRYVNALRSGLAALERKRESLPGLVADLDRVKREVQVAESLRDRFRAQQESFRISQSLVEESQYEIIEDARVNVVPVWPDRRMIIAIGILAGLFIGGAVTFVVEYSDRSLKNVSSTEEFLGFPVVGVVPRIEKLSGKT